MSAKKNVNSRFMRAPVRRACTIIFRRKKNKRFAFGPALGGNILHKYKFPTLGLKNVQ